MIFFSRNGAYRLVLKSSDYKFHKTGGDREERVPEWGVTAAFKPLPGQGIHLKGKLWKGKLDTEEVAAEFARSRKDITEAQLASALMIHPNYGADMIAFGDDGEAVEDDALLTAVGDGTFTCEACDQVLKNAQGIPGHFGSQKHKDNRAKYIKNLAREFKL